VSLFATVAASDRSEATIYLSEIPIENISAATVILLGESKNGAVFRATPIRE
tara:strand:- start:41 stop:196 length:156 start_codon:yes stop_codon:yes gene_type:complete